ncbi:MAG: primase C-terminal domain-containing protein [Spirochaetales bacterium]|nr:primase C-terminal domain-containing protein [Spirochaetales bacterium]
MTLHYSNSINQPKNKTYPFETHDLAEAVKHDHVMARFRNNNRSIENFISCDCLYGDIDNGETENEEEWITEDRFNALFHEYDYYLVTSRNHMKDKVDERKTVSARPRFHVYFPLGREVGGVELGDLLRKLQSTFNFFDPKVVDIARLFFGNKDAVIVENKGKSISDLLAEPVVSLKMPVDSSRQGIESITRGGRNAELFRLACKWIEIYPLEDVGPMLYQANDLLEEPLSLKEVDSILRSVKRYKPEDAKKIIRNYRKIKRQIPDKDGNTRTQVSIEHELEYTKEMAEPSSLFYSFIDASGRKYMFLREGADYFITDPKDLHFILAKNGFVLDFTYGKEITEAKYLVFLREHCEAYRRITCLPEPTMQRDTLYRGSQIEPKKNGLFMKLVNTATLESVKDQYRYASMLLSSFMNSTFDGEKPLFAIIAPSVNSGKSYSTRKGCRCITGRDPLEFRANDSDEKQMSGLVAFENPFVLIDNIQNATNDQLLNITLRVTDITIPSHIMYVSHSRVVNNKTYACTFNTGESINTDVLNRTVTIMMTDGRDVSLERKAEISEAFIELEAKWKDIVADVLACLAEVDFSRDVPVKKHAKFSRWSVAMAKMLRPFYPEIEEFDFSLSAEDEEYADDRMMFEEFLDDVLGDMNDRFFAISDLVERWREKNKSYNTTASSLTRRMKNMRKSLKNFRIDYNKDFGKRGWHIARQVA